MYNPKIILPIAIILIATSIYLSATAIIQTNKIQKQLISYRDNIVLETRIKQAESNITAIANFINNQIQQAKPAEPK